MRRHSSEKAASVRIGLGGGFRQRVVGRDRHEGGAEQGVRPRRVDLELGMAGRRRAGLQRPADHQALGTADPVLLHQPDLVRPAVEAVEGGQQVVGDSR
jgi:hypothetical protein